MIKSKATKIFIPILIIFLIAFSLIYYIFLNDRVEAVVEGKVYRSSKLNEKTLLKAIKEHKIRSILNLTGYHDNSSWFDKEIEIAEKNSIKLYNINISPHKLPRYNAVNNIINILQQSEKPLLVHCYRGIDRTGMVSALSLAIEQDLPLPVIKRQFSLRYGVLPFFRSVGPYFFSKYELWLRKTGRVHGKDNLLSWIKNEYIDEQGNFEFYIDHINNGRSVLKSNKVVLSGLHDNIKMDGWAFDAKQNLPVDSLFVVSGNRVISEGVLKINRADVARYFDLDARYHEVFLAGWTAEFAKNDLQKGCNKIYLRFNSVDIDSGYTFCVDS